MAFYRGVCNGQTAEENEIFTMSKLSLDAEALKEVESNTFLSSVKYDIFWGKVKLVGYTMKLRPDHMRLISDAINLDYDGKIQNY